MRSCVGKLEKVQILHINRLKNVQNHYINMLKKCETSLKNKWLFVKGIINYDKAREVSRKMYRELLGDCEVV